MTNADYIPWSCPVRGGKLYCRKYGNSSESLLLVHGACVDADCFDETAALLSDQYSVYTFDRRGYGRNNSNEGGSLGLQSDDIRLLLERIGDNCVIIAHSAGYCPVIHCLENHPDLVKGVLFYEPFALDILPGKIGAEKITAIQKQIDAQDYFVAAALFARIIGSDESDVIPTESEIRHLEKNYRCFFRNEFSSLYQGKINAGQISSSRILVGLGNSSLSTVRADMAEALAAKFNTRIILYPDGHNCPRVHPKEFAAITKKALRSFFD
ncbi:MAG: alpha/beta fold hydrolase [Lachnospiraceae bacterium]|jgi:pimeloyl-ACP methyl ester carboxylesterase